MIPGMDLKTTALFVGLTIQTGAGFWWAAQVTAKLDFTAEAVREMRSERYTASDAARDRAVDEAKREDLRRRIEQIEQREQRDQSDRRYQHQQQQPR